MPKTKTPQDKEAKKPKEPKTETSGFAKFMTPGCVENYLRPYTKGDSDRVAVQVSFGSNKKDRTFNLEAGKYGISAPILFPKEIFNKEHDIGPIVGGSVVIIGLIRRKHIREDHLKKFDQLCEEDKKRNELKKQKEAGQCPNSNDTKSTTTPPAAGQSPT